jgi:hypothetical protein
MSSLTVSVESFEIVISDWNELMTQPSSEAQAELAMANANPTAVIANRAEPIFTGPI